MQKELHVGRLSSRRHWTNVLTRYTVGGAAVIEPVPFLPICYGLLRRYSCRQTSKAQLNIS